MEHPSPEIGREPWVEGAIDRWRERRGAIGLLVFAAIAASVGAAWWRSGSSAPALPPVPSGPVSEPPTSTTTVVAELVVHVVGAVRAPGVVRVRDGTRVIDALNAAGGAAPRADLGALNLAARVTDGARIVVPAVGEAPPPQLPGDAATGSGVAPGGGVPGPIDVNRATAEELDALPGVGPATATAIVREREANGPFRSPDDLERVRGIGPAKLATLRDLVRV